MFPEGMYPFSRFTCRKEGVKESKSRSQPYCWSEVRRPAPIFLHCAVIPCAETAFGPLSSCRCFQEGHGMPEPWLDPSALQLSLGWHALRCSEESKLFCVEETCRCHHIKEKRPIMVASTTSKSALLRFQASRSEERRKS